MNPMLIKYLIVCPFVFLAGFVDAIAGGGGLISLPAYLIAGLPAHNAIATNKMSSSMGSTASAIKYAKEGFIPWKIALPAAAFSLGGSAIGANLSLLIDEKVLKVILLVLIPVTAVLVLRNRILDAEKEPLPLGKTMLLAFLIAFFIGMYDGFYGPGTGTFLLVLLTSVVHMKLQEANGTKNIINLASNLSALFVFLRSGNTWIPLGLAAGAFSIAGSYLGARTFTGKGAKVVRPIMIAVLAIFLIKVIIEMLGK